MNFVSWWETGIALIIFNILLFVLTIVSFGVGFKQSAAKSKEKKGTTVVKIYKTSFSTICFFTFLGSWMFLTIFMAFKGWM